MNSTGVYQGKRVRIRARAIPVDFRAWMLYTASGCIILPVKEGAPVWR